MIDERILSTVCRQCSSKTEQEEQACISEYKVMVFLRSAGIPLYY